MLAACPDLFPWLFFQAGHHVQSGLHSLGTLVPTWGFNIQRFICWSKLAMTWSLNPFPIQTLCDQAWLCSAVQRNRTLAVSPWFLWQVATTALCWTQRPCWFCDRIHTSYPQVGIKGINSHSAELLLASTVPFLPVLIELFAWVLLVWRDICQINHFCRAEIYKYSHFLPSLRLG